MYELETASYRRATTRRLPPVVCYKAGAQVAVLMRMGAYDVRSTRENR
jgi:hypothetical protein